MTAAWALLVMTGGPLGAQADPADSVHLRNDCRLAAQVLTLGEPANRRDWALDLIGSCGDQGAPVIAELLERHRSADTWNEELDRVANEAWGTVDRRIFDAAVDIAADPGAGAVARIQALRVVESQLLPGHNVQYEALSEPGHPIPGPLLHPAAAWERLPDEVYRIAEEELRNILVEHSEETSLGFAAGVVYRTAVQYLYCTPEMSFGECLTAVESRVPGG